MPNPTTGLLETLVAASAIASESLKYSNSFIDNIFWDYQPINAEFGNTLNVNVPTVSEGDVSDIGSGPLQPTDVAHTTTAIVLDSHLSTSFVIKSWDKIRTPAMLSEMYMKPRLEALLRKANRKIVNLISFANFGTNAQINGATANEITRANIALAWSRLIGQGAPEGAQFVLTSNQLVYSTMTADTSFYQESIVGVEASVAATQRATIAPQFNARVRWDQQMGIDAGTGHYAAIFYHPFAIAGVTVNMPSADDPSVKEVTVFPKPRLPVQIQSQYSLKDQGTLIHLHLGMGAKVVRPELGQYMTTG